MSVIDKWLNIHRQNAGAATSATSATNRNHPCNYDGLDVASRLLQAATFPPDVATCSNRAATEKPIKGQCLNADAADVANVAGGETRKAKTASRGSPELGNHRLSSVLRMWGADHRAAGDLVGWRAVPSHMRRGGV